MIRANRATIRLFVACLVADLAACAPGPKKPPGPKSAPEMPMHTPDASTTAPLCTSLAELAKHEGTPVRVRGTFRFPTEKAFARNKLLLDDGTIVILSRPVDLAVAAVLAKSNQGARMIVRGVAYAKEIPARYRIIGRTPDPYLVDIETIDIGR